REELGALTGTRDSLSDRVATLKAEHTSFAQAVQEIESSQAALMRSITTLRSYMDGTETADAPAAANDDAAPAAAQ
ncbi:MAG: hypothetical protein AAGD34_12775, partial [Pseudomonadota bacterium]